jgi:hypothetical protein
MTDRLEPAVPTPHYVNRAVPSPWAEAASFLSLRFPQSKPLEKPAKPLENLLEGANYLLAYAVEAGIEVDPHIVNKILAADKQGESSCRQEIDGQLVTAITGLACKLQPVTVETLRACRDDAHRAIQRYEICVMFLAMLLLPASILGAVYTGIVNKINTQINEANEIVLQLNSLPSSSANKISALQQLTIRTRAIKSRATQLDFFNLDLPNSAKISKNRSDDTQMTENTEQSENDIPDRIELPSNIDPNNSEKIQDQIAEKTRIYQNVRYKAKGILENTSIWFGAVSTTLLPILYALLGAFASVLRAFRRQYEMRTFDHSYASGARFIIAAIAGGVIGLFNFAIGEGMTVSPLALAFLVGYSTDIFFSALEGAVPNATKGATPVPKLTLKPKSAE